MIDRFKFFSDNNEQEIPEGYVNLENMDLAGWIWFHIQPSNYQNYEMVTVETNGIVNFLRLFHPQQIVVVVMIVGPNNRIHTGYGDDGWGFNIQTDPLTITYLRYGGNL